MTAVPQSVLQRLRQAALAQEGGPTDGELMERFTARRDAGALEALIRRHGPMVLSVCQRVLGNGPDAEDAFQASFLVFVRKAASIRSRELVGPWLYGVAYRTALKARGAAARRRVQERRAATMNPTHADSDDGWADLLPLLDRELSRLPEKYRTAIVLCELEGRPRKEAARKLGVPEGTLSSRLATGKRMLARRLAGPKPPAGCVLAAALARGTPMPPPLLTSTAKAASLVAGGKAAAAVVSARVAALAEGVMKTMLLTKLAVAVLAAVAVVATGGVVACRVMAAPAAPAPNAAPAEPAKGDKPADGVTARIVAPKEVAATDPELKGELVLTNDGDAPVRVCTLTPGNDGLGGAFGQHFRPDWWKSDRPPLEESAKKVTTLAPGKSVSFPFTIRGIHYKDRDSFAITGFYAVEDQEFADKLGLWLGKAEAQPVKVAVRKEDQWGEAVDGVQVRLRPLSAGAEDADLRHEFFLDVRNQGEKTPSQCRVPNFCEIEWDGRRYRYGGKGDLECKSTSLQPGKEIDEWVKLSLDMPWVQEDDPDKRLQVAPGKHTLRGILVLNDGSLPTWIRPVSQPVSIEVGKESAWGEPDGGVRARVRTAKEVWRADEPVRLTLDLRNEGKSTANARRVPYDCQIEVDGTWYSFDMPSGPYPAVGDPLEPGKEVDEWTNVLPDGKDWSSLTPRKEPFSLPPGKHTLRIAYRLQGEKVLRPISGPVEIEVLQDGGWGKAEDGVQARLRPTKAAWDVGESPEFKLDLRNQGEHHHQQCRVPLFCEIEFDGRWYMHGGPYVLRSLVCPLEAGKEIDDWVALSLDGPWVRKAPGRGLGDPIGDEDERLTVGPGKHTLRVAFVLEGGLRPVSQTVEIVVGAQSDWGKDDGGIQARVRTPKAVWGAKEAPTFIVDLQNVGEGRPRSGHVPFECEIEVDGTWYNYTGPVDDSSPVTVLEPGKQYLDWVTVKSDALWQEKAPKARKPRPLLPLTPGKHAIRILYPLDVEKPPLRPVSGSIEIEVRQEG